MRGWFEFAETQILFGLICVCLIFLIIMIGELLHYVSDGAIPQFVEWQPAQREARAPSLIKYVGEEDEEEAGPVSVGWN
ncbi:MAG TPA: hypothetical protein VNQ90_08520 [Chthoniobacteraceae bacterium]|nr:hypothetical protein [Chthoniobacteraceae bacterium]